MRQRWVNLNDSDRAAYRAAVAFLDGRLAERATVDWALRLKPNEAVMRMALLDLIDSPAGQKISEPWQSAWRLIEEYWNNPVIEDSSTGAYEAQHRLRAGDRSGSLVTRIVELVAPRLNVELFTQWELQHRQPPRRPKNVTDLFSVRMTSGEIIDPDLLELGREVDRSFLLSLGLALDVSVGRGLDIAQRLGWSNEGKLWQLGGLYRVYYVPAAERAEGEHDPDKFHRGIAPAVKLLHAVVARLVDIDIPAATELINRWKLSKSPIRLRLWAAVSRDSRVASAYEVGAWLMSLDNSCFWDLHDYPEISELRARRFVELKPEDQAAMTGRIRKGPPRSELPRLGDRDRVEQAKDYWIVRELRRIEVAGGVLAARDKNWMDAMSLRFLDLVQMTRLDEGFSKSSEAHWVAPSPDNRFDLLRGEERLKALEAAFTLGRRGWDDDPTTGATDWISHSGNPVRILSDLESVPAGGAAFGEVWERFGWAHSPAAGQGENGKYRDLSAECSRVLSLLAALPEATLRRAIRGISHWLSAWEEQVVVLPEGLSIWLKVWPIAIETTNLEQQREELTINTVTQSPEDREPEDLDTLNTPAGKLVGVFLAACRKHQIDKHPFEADRATRKMRDAVIAAGGRAGLIARHRMIEFLSYFLFAAPEWTNEHLVTPLIADTSETMALWRAIARRTRFSDVLMIIGNSMVERATDQRLGRETRCSLVFSLVIECLHAFREQRKPAVPFVSIQQMIRSLDDEVRAYGAQAVQRFVHDFSAQYEEAPDQVFRSAAAPFLQHVWPQERSLATPGVSQALAGLPATTRDAYVEAVDAIERFLVPFDCWSMIDYGLYGEEEGGRSKLSSIDVPEKAAAFLRLLDRTIGTAEGSVIPHELADALDQVRKVAPKLANTQEYRRLATAARR